MLFEAPELTHPNCRYEYSLDVVSNLIRQYMVLWFRRSSSWTQTESWLWLRLSESGAAEQSDHTVTMIRSHSAQQRMLRAFARTVHIRFEVTIALPTIGSGNAVTAIMLTAGRTKISTIGTLWNQTFQKHRHAIRTARVVLREQAGGHRQKKQQDAVWQKSNHHRPLVKKVSIRDSKVSAANSRQAGYFAKPRRQFKLPRLFIFTASGFTASTVTSTRFWRCRFTSSRISTSRRWCSRIFATS